jgi:hypothetical protein
MNNIGLSFTLRLVILLSVAFLIHSGIQHWSGQGSFENHIIATYLFNFVLAILFFFVLLYYKKKKSTQLGFIFLFSSALKFTFFFIFLSPMVRTLNGIHSAEFISFFIPYSVSLSAEVYYLSKILNK